MFLKTSLKKLVFNCFLKTFVCSQDLKILAKNLTLMTFDEKLLLKHDVLC